MIGKINNLISQEDIKEYGKEAAEETKALVRGGNEFDGADDEFEEACAEENAFDAACAAESAARARLKRAKNMAGYVTLTANNPKEKGEEENTEGNRKQPAKKHVGGSHSWAKESAARARSQRVGNLARYATGIAKDPGEDEEEENAAGNRKQPERNPFRGSHGWGNGNAPMSAPITLGIHGGTAG